jgi:hypothetical protein
MLKFSGLSDLCQVVIIEYEILKEVLLDMQYRQSLNSFRTANVELLARVKPTR